MARQAADNFFFFIVSLTRALTNRLKEVERCGFIGQTENDGGDRRDVVPDSAFTVFRARVNAHLARAPTALIKINI